MSSSSSAFSSSSARTLRPSIRIAVFVANITASPSARGRNAAASAAIVDRERP